MEKRELSQQRRMSRPLVSNQDRHVDRGLQQAYIVEIAVVNGLLHPGHQVLPCSIELEDKAIVQRRV